ncbi:WD40 repeat-like protein [Ceratobasidium sp. AG-I]|nr:WD40 repeat-like protein [Ceratobasidium sp. AG-I]
MASSESTGRTICSLDTELPADSVEFCPRDGSRQVLVCGTYNLVKDDGKTEIEAATQPQTRNGRCLVYEFDGTSQELKEVQRLETAAILDLKWSHNFTTSNPILALAESVGRLQIYEWNGQEKELSTLQMIQVAEPHVLCLSIDWNDRISSQGLGSLVVSKSDGSVSTLKPNESQFDVEITWHAHDFEPWVAAWNYWVPNIVYSGGDDCKLKGWDTRTDCSSPVFTNKRFEAGVTCIQSHPFVENMLGVGSYDNTVRFFDTRKMSSPVADVEVGGGAWRVKWHPLASRKEDLLVACMHGGFKIVNYTLKDTNSQGMEVDSPVVTSRYDAHTSLAYGVDWQHSQSREGVQDFVASCSFYDHSLHLWSP